MLAKKVGNISLAYKQHKKTANSDLHQNTKNYFS